MLLRISALIAIIASAVAFALTIVLLTSGADPANAEANYWLQLNTSRVGQDLIRLPAAAPSSGFTPLPSPADPLAVNLTAALAAGLQDLQGAIVANLSAALAIQPIYNLFLTHICEGGGNPLPGSPTMTACYTYQDTTHGLLRIARSIPQHFTVGATNVTVPLVAALAGALADTVDLGVMAALALFVLGVIAAAAAGLALLTSLASVALHHRYLVLAAVGWSALAAVAAAALALVGTGLVYGGARAGGVGEAVGVVVSPGKMFVDKAWIAAAAALVAFGYWAVVWFVDYRRTSFARRRRKEYEIGDWVGTWGEVWKDLKTPKRREFG